GGQHEEPEEQPRDHLGAERRLTVEKEKQRNRDRVREDENRDHEREAQIVAPAGGHHIAPEQPQVVAEDQPGLREDGAHASGGGDSSLVPVTRRNTSSSVPWWPERSRSSA